MSVRCLICGEILFRKIIEGNLNSLETRKEEVVSLPCGHLFHQKCIAEESYSFKNSTPKDYCPVVECNKKYSAREIRPTLFDADSKEDLHLAKLHATIENLQLSLARQTPCSNMLPPESEVPFSHQKSKSKWLEKKPLEEEHAGNSLEEIPAMNPAKVTSMQINDLVTWTKYNKRYEGIVLDFEVKDEVLYARIKPHRIDDKKRLSFMGSFRHKKNTLIPVHFLKRKLESNSTDFIKGQRSKSFIDISNSSTIFEDKEKNKNFPRQNVKDQVSNVVKRNSSLFGRRPHSAFIDRPNIDKTIFESFEEAPHWLCRSTSVLSDPSFEEEPLEKLGLPKSPTTLSFNGLAPEFHLGDPVCWRESYESHKTAGTIVELDSMHATVEYLEKSNGVLHAMRRKVPTLILEHFDARYDGRDDQGSTISLAAPSGSHWQLDDAAAARPSCEEDTSNKNELDVISFDDGNFEDDKWPTVAVDAADEDPDGLRELSAESSSCIHSTVLALFFPNKNFPLLSHSVEDSDIASSVKFTLRSQFLKPMQNFDDYDRKYTMKLFENIRFLGSAEPLDFETLIFTIFSVFGIPRFISYGLGYGEYVHELFFDFTGLQKLHTTTAELFSNSLLKQKFSLYRVPYPYLILQAPHYRKGRIRRYKCVVPSASIFLRGISSRFCVMCGNNARFSAKPFFPDNGIAHLSRLGYCARCVAHYKEGHFVPAMNALCPDIRIPDGDFEKTDLNLISIVCRQNNLYTTLVKSELEVDSWTYFAEQEDGILRRRSICGLSSVLSKLETKVLNGGDIEVDTLPSLINKILKYGRAYIYQ